MKSILKKIVYSTLCIGVLSTTSCNEGEFLKEVPLDFYSPENSYVTYENYQGALTELYARVRGIHFNFSETNNFVHFLGTDVAQNARGDAARLGNYTDTFRPENGIFSYHWNEWYKVIANANTILSRIGNSNLTDAQKAEIAAEAKFFRGFAYRHLGYLWGGVPIVLEEAVSPRADFNRNTKEEVFAQVVADLEAAAAQLPAIDKVADGKVSNLLAYHYLAETYIYLGKFDQAITAVSRVIDDPNTALMVQRFGTRKGEPGDVIWDLYQRGNQNRKAGNTEAIWVAQMEVDVPGGLLTTTESNYINGFERMVSPALWSCTDPDGKAAFIATGVSDYNQAGRGVSFMSNTNWLIYDAWGADFDNDLRNSSYNFVRTGTYDLPTSKYYGKAVNDPAKPSKNWTTQKWRWYPHPMKVTTPGNHPDAIYADPVKKTLKSNAGSTFRDMYYLRLAESYLLRAEAYHLKGDNAKAAADINVVRSRAKASPVEPANVTIDYILDERARELFYEEQRRITLHRTGKLLERVRKYCDLNKGNILDHHNLWPIPYAEIEANKDVVLEQNPGY